MYREKVRSNGIFYTFNSTLCARKILTITITFTI